jgi:Mlc titration factor MtfA (ptsG expression regulator)
MFTWFQDHRRQLLREAPFPAEWEGYVAADVPQFAHLSVEEGQALRAHVPVFMAEKHWEGAAGLTVTDEMKVVVAAQACLLLLGLPHHDFYPNVTSIILYPYGYRVREEEPGEFGVVHTGVSHRLGEAWRDGPVILSWADARGGARNPEDGHNVVLHEFAHKLDMRDGWADGVPYLPEGQGQYDEWADVMSAEYERLRDEVEDGHADVLDGYGATDEAEFFAVATECFFEKPVQLRERRPRLYDVLRRYYRQDTAARVETAAP